MPRNCSCYRIWNTSDEAVERGYRVVAEFGIWRWGGGGTTGVARGSGGRRRPLSIRLYLRTNEGDARFRGRLHCTYL